MFFMLQHAAARCDSLYAVFVHLRHCACSWPWRQSSAFGVTAIYTCNSLYFVSAPGVLFHTAGFRCAQHHWCISLGRDTLKADLPFVSTSNTAKCSYARDSRGPALHCPSYRISSSSGGPGVHQLGHWPQSYASTCLNPPYCTFTSCIHTGACHCCVVDRVDNTAVLASSWLNPRLRR